MTILDSIWEQSQNASKLKQLDKGEISSDEVEDFVEHLKNIYEAQ